MIVASALWMVISPAGRVRGAIPDGRLRLTFIDVGQADATLVRFPDASAMLVDTGGSATGSFDSGSRVILPVLWALDVYSLDVLAISHADPDHVGGAATLVRDFTIREIWEGIPVPRDRVLTALMAQARARGVRWQTRTAGERVNIGGVDVRVWHPPRADWERQKVRNDDSLVLELRFKQVSILLPGDIGRDIERGLAPGFDLGPLRVVKVPHHGSVTSSSPEFLRAVRPAIAILTVARDRSSAALDGVLARYRDIGAVVFRTGDDGAITVETDGHSVEVQTFEGKTMKVSSVKQD